MHHYYALSAALCPSVCSVLTIYTCSKSESHKNFEFIGDNAVHMGTE